MSVWQTRTSWFIGAILAIGHRGRLSHLILKPTFKFHPGFDDPVEFFRVFS
jgi:hypothetical protein